MQRPTMDEYGVGPGGLFLVLCEDYAEYSYYLRKSENSTANSLIPECEELLISVYEGASQKARFNVGSFFRTG